MRARVLVCCVLALTVVACSGGLLPTPARRSGHAPAPTPTRPLAMTVAAPEATETPHPLPTPTAGPPEELSAEDAPEIAAGLVPPEERDRYLRLVTSLAERDPIAADWLVTSGVLLADARLDSEETGLLALMLETKGDPLYYLTHLRTQDGVTAEDVEYSRANTVMTTAEWYLGDDQRGLEAYELLTAEGARSLQRIYERAHEDAEVRKGLYLINTLGLPARWAFKYPVPTYNVQLYALTRLLERGVPGVYERAAVAAALTYGSLLTLCDDQARQYVLDYAAERVRFLIETDVLLSAAGAGWRAKDYPLEALMSLLWAGQAAAYPAPGQPLREAPGLRAAAAARLLTQEDVVRLLVDMACLREMQEEMVRAIVEETGDEARACELVEQWWSEHRRDEPDDGGPDMNRQWARWREGQGFAGGADSGYVLQGLAASINLALPWAELWYAEGGELKRVPFGLRIAGASRRLVLSDSARRSVSQLTPETPLVLVWWRAPWDDWRLSDAVRAIQTLPLPPSVWREGIPSGYLLRRGAMSEQEALSALGLAPTPRQ
ncbi:MAG: hypothetical protein K6V36_11465 [Anaerolineae bacterium]|nr:hypothetical protein [Anaerolineae bacterium]